MISRLLASILLLSISLTGNAHADDVGKTPKGVIELFVSQGCMSCVAADRAMSYLAVQQDIVALAYHVDYWNYRGWTDPLSRPENSNRQYGYAHTLGRSGVYTPQAILNGREQQKGTDVAVLNKRLDVMRARGSGLHVPIRAVSRGGKLKITVGEGSGEADIVVVYFRKRQDMEITKGTNEGQKVSNWNSVTDVQTVGVWSGEETKLVLPSKVMGEDKSDGCAILVQMRGPNGEPGAILGATILTAKQSS